MRLALLPLAFFATLAVPLAQPAPACGDALRLNEILAGPARDWDGSGAYSARDDEWVEVVNAGPSPLDLGVYFITDADSVPRYAFAGTLGAGARRVVFGREAYDWERATGRPAFGLSLGNGGDAVLLWRVAAAETLLEDAYAYRSHEAAPDRAVGRLPDALGEWQLFDGLNPYSGTASPPGNGCAPSPLAPNACDFTPAAGSTWGRLKALYR
ncbi:MAG: hypothetical protein A2V63_01040 [Candidatus Eisenbacteria bacterium RBG_19FT_COMBO_70_11]|nr:MAG: hypothetical protein A2V63_01040 [Candidatus Eisenbacteria bacterium RBG_19FT_COMBO_70_11]